MKARMLWLAVLALGLAMCDAGCRLAADDGGDGDGDGDSIDGDPSGELGDGGDGDGDGDGDELEPPAELYSAYATATGPVCGLDGGAVGRCEPLDLCLEIATAICERVGGDGEFATCGGEIYGAWATADGPVCGHDGGAVARCLPGDVCASVFDSRCQFVRTNAETCELPYQAWATATGPSCGIDGGAIARCMPGDLCLDTFERSCL